MDASTPATSASGNTLGDRTVPPATEPRDRRVRVSLRSLFILVIALIGGILTEELLRRSGMPAGQAVVAGGAAFGGTFYFLERIVE